MEVEGKEITGEDGVIFGKLKGTQLSFSHSKNFISLAKILFKVGRFLSLTNFLI